MQICVQFVIPIISCFRCGKIHNSCVSVSFWDGPLLFLLHNVTKFCLILRLKLVTMILKTELRDILLLYLLLQPIHESESLFGSILTIESFSSCIYLSFFLFQFLELLQKIIFFLLKLFFCLLQLLPLNFFMLGVYDCSYFRNAFGENFKLVLRHISLGVAAHQMIEIGVCRHDWRVLGCL